MAEVDPVILQLRVDRGRYLSELRTTTSRADELLERQERSVVRLERQYQQSFAGIGRSAGAGARLLTAAFATLGSIAVARSFLQVADTAKQIEASLKLATASTGSFGQAQADVSRIADTTRSGLKETADLYSTFQRNAEELGISQEQAARATETVAKAFQISGASAAEAAGGIRQFLQGIQSGTLRGEELNSVLENAPRLARLLAESLGVTIGELRALGEEGQLTGDKLIRALTDRKFTAGLDAEFKQLPVTFDQSVTRLQNRAIEVFGAFDRGGEFSTALANFVSDGADGFASLADDAQDLGATIRSTFETLGDAFDPLVLAGQAFFGGLQTDTENFSARFRREIGALFSRLDQLNAFGAEYFGTARTSYGDAFRNRNAIRDQSARDQSLRRILDDGQARAAARPTAASVGGGRGGSRPRTGGKSAAELLKEADEKATRDFAEVVARGRIDALSDAAINTARQVEERITNFFDQSGYDQLEQEAERRANALSEAEVEAIDRTKAARDQAIFETADLYETLFLDGTKGLWDRFKFEGLRAVALVLAQLSQGQSLAGALSGAGGGGIFGGIATAIGGLFGRASGGYVGPGQLYRVNEAASPGRVEGFRPAGSGTIIPLGQMNQAVRPAGMTVVQNITVDARNSVNPAGFEQRILAQANQFSARAAATAGQQALRQMPQRLSQYQTDGT